MKKFALKALAAVCLMGPVVAFAATDSATLASTTFDVVSNFYDVVYTAKWPEAKSYQTGFQDSYSQLTRVTWDLLGDNGGVHKSGSFTNIAAKTADVSFASLEQNHYTLTLTGSWLRPETGWTVDVPEGSWTPKSMTPSISAVPEPETYAMLLAGLGLIGTIMRRRRASAAF